MVERIKVGFILTIACLLLLLVAVAFWYQEGQYTLPTPRPPGLTQTAVGLPPAMPAEMMRVLHASPSRPTLLHFFNPDCLCSKFNLDHIRELQDTYKDTVNILVIVESGADGDRAAELRQQDLNAPLIPDTDGNIAKSCGVYSTPQAVILDKEGHLFYRGNYNLARYCSNPETEFARLALEAVVAGRSLPHFPAEAERAYGCALPANQKISPP